MINPRSIIISSIVISLLLTVLLYNLTASAFALNTYSETLLSKESNLIKADQVATNSSNHNSNPDQSAQNQLQNQSCDLSQRFPESVLQWCEIITNNAIEHQIDPDLLAALILQESAGDPLAYSHSGAVGLMQVMPRDGIAKRFTCKNGPCFSNRPTIEELQQPEYNVAYGTKMLVNLLTKTGSIRDALKAYGPMDVGYSYADIVMGLYNQYKN